MISSKWGRCIKTTDELLKAILNNLDSESNLENNDDCETQRFVSPSTNQGEDQNTSTTSVSTPSQEYTINDSQYRFFLTRTGTRVSLENLTHTTIRVGGMYHAPGAIHSSEKRLHYIIASENEENLSLALIAVKYASEMGVLPTMETLLKIQNSIENSVVDSSEVISQTMRVAENRNIASEEMVNTALIDEFPNLVDPIADESRNQFVDNSSSNNNDNSNSNSNSNSYDENSYLNTNHHHQHYQNNDYHCDIYSRENHEVNYYSHRHRTSLDLGPELFEYLDKLSGVNGEYVLHIFEVSGARIKFIERWIDRHVECEIFSPTISSLQQAIDLVSDLADTIRIDVLNHDHQLKSQDLDFLQIQNSDQTSSLPSSTTSSQSPFSISSSSGLTPFTSPPHQPSSSSTSSSSSSSTSFSTPIQTQSSSQITSSSPTPLSSPLTSIQPSHSRSQHSNSSPSPSPSHLTHQRLLKHPPSSTNHQSFHLSSVPPLLNLPPPSFLSSTLHSGSSHHNLFKQNTEHSKRGHDHEDVQLLDEEPLVNNKNSRAAHNGNKKNRTESLIIVNHL